MSDTTIDEILKEFLDETDWVLEADTDHAMNDPDFYDRPLKTAKSALYDLIDKKIIGEDEPDETDKWTPEMADVISATRRIIYGRNALRAEQRNKLKELFDD